MSDNVVDLARVRQAKSQKRGARGRFAVTRSPEELLDVIREVAKAAGRRWPEDCPDPTRIKQDIWNAAKRQFEAERGWIPNANAACKQLRKATGRPLSWGTWVLLAFAENRDKVLSTLFAEPTRAPLAEGDIALAMHLVAARLGNETFGAPAYDEARHDQITDWLNAGRSRSQAQRLLPSSEQIITACGSWEAARRLAGFETVRPREGGRALTVAQAIALFYARSGYLPSKKVLARFARDRFSLVNIVGAWPEHIEAGVAEIARRGLPQPPPYGTSAAPEGWQPTDLDIGLRPPGTQEYSLVEKLETVMKFRAWCTESEVRPTHRRYRQWCTGRRGTPGLNALIREDTMKDLLARLTEPDWKTKAAAEDVRRQKARDVVRRAKALSRRVRTSDAELVRQLLMLGESLPMREIAQQLGWSIRKARDVVPPLVEAGMLERCNPFVHAPNQRYRLADTQTQADQ
jgi:hypothetical protein